MSTKIVHFVTRSDTIGGVHTHILDLVHHTIDRGIETSIICGNSHNHFLQSHLRAKNIPYITLRNFTNTSSFFQDICAFIELSVQLHKLKPFYVYIPAKQGYLVALLVSFSVFPVYLLFTVGHMRVYP